MRNWQKILMVLVVYGALRLVWENLSDPHRLIFVAICVIWVFLSFVAVFLRINQNDKECRPNPWGTRFQKQTFWETMIFGPLVLFLMAAATKDEAPN